MGPTGSNAGALWNSSPFYVSPEQVMGAPANELSDIYSLGIMLYEICTGTVPFLGNSAESIMMQQVNTVPASPSLINPKLPPALSTVVMRCIAKDPKARFPSVLALVAALTNVEGQSPVNVSHPENVGQSSGSFATQERDMPTVISAKMSPLPAGLVASGPMYASNAQMGGISQPYSSTQWADKSRGGHSTSIPTCIYTCRDIYATPYSTYLKKAQRARPFDCHDSDIDSGSYWLSPGCISDLFLERDCYYNSSDYRPCLLCQ